MTKEMLKEIESLMNDVCGGELWFMSDEWTEEKCDEVCDRCPYCGKCYDMGIQFGCPVWEESMGEDL